MATRKQEREREQRKFVAYHEAGHAVMAIAEGQRFRRVTIIPEEGSLGHVLVHRRKVIQHGEEITPAKIAKIERSILICFAGPIAERTARGVKGRWNHQGAAGDYTNAVQWAAMRHGDSQSIELYLNYLGYRATLLVQANWIAIERLASILQSEWTMTEAGAKAVIDGAWADYCKQSGPWSPKFGARLTK